MVHDDTAQAPIIADILESEGISSIVMVQRDDVWGQGLSTAISESFDGNEALITFIPTSPSTTTEYHQSIATQIRDKVEEFSQNDGGTVDHIAVMYISFDADAVGLANAILADNDMAAALSTVKWYGTDGLAATTATISDGAIAGFYEGVGMTATLFEVADNPVNQKLAAHLAQQGNLDYAFTNSVYDAVYLLADSVIAAAETNNAVTARSLILDVASGVASHSYHHGDRVLGDGSLGAYTLNDAGDLSEPNTYERLKVTMQPDGSYMWESIPLKAPPKYQCR